jgi:hypothetical protein
VLKSLPPGALDTTRTHTEDGVERIVPLRWFVVDIIQHYAEHLGQMRLTRQLWEAQNA